MTSRKKIVAGAIAVTLGAGGLLGATQGTGSINVFVGNDTIPTPSANVANLWVDTNGGTCTRQSTAGAYSDAAACSSFNTAWQAASAGDSVLVKAGSYGAQELEVKGGSAAPNVVIKSAPSETVSFSTLISDGADFVSVMGTSTNPMTGNEVKGTRCLDADFTGDPQCKQSDNDVFEWMILSQGYTDAKVIDCMGGCVGTIFRHIDGCCTLDEKIVNVDNWLNNGQSRNLLFEYSDFHSQQLSQGGGVIHSECMWLLGAHPIRLNGVRLWGCKSGSGDLTFSSNGDAEVPGDITIENSIFEQAMEFDGSIMSSLWSLDPSVAWQGTNVIRNNFFEGPTAGAAAPASGTSITWTNNIGSGPGCGSGTESFNRWSNANCGGTNTQDASAFSSGRYVAAPVAGRDSNSQADAQLHGDWHWSNCSQTGVDAGTGTGAPSSDLDAHARPFNSVFDQGPFECGAS